jgi:hypothetical protein
VILALGHALDEPTGGADGWVVCVSAVCLVADRHLDKALMLIVFDAATLGTVRGGTAIFG